MSGVIYLMQGEGSLVPMTEQAYDSEDILQRLLADYPDLLGGEQMNAASPRRWLLLAREAGLPSEESGGDRWSVDQRTVDQDGIPTIVEVKRSTDSRIRREVVGQMLDYAANAVVYWPVDRLRSRFETMCEQEERNPESILAESLGINGDAEEFWKLVRTNLQAGRVRLVFVADIIPPELRRVVEFLNQQMNPAEVLAVEVRQYAGEGQQALVPRVIGQTQQAIGNKQTGYASERRTWDEPTFLERIELMAGPQATTTARELLNWSRAKGLRLWWGSGETLGSFYPLIDTLGRHHWLYSAWTSGRITIEFGNIKKSPAFVDDSRRLELMRRLNEIDGVSIPVERIDKWPSFPITTLADSASLSHFLAAFDWVISEIRAE